VRSRIRFRYRVNAERRGGAGPAEAAPGEQRGRSLGSTAPSLPDAGSPFLSLAEEEVDGAALSRLWNGGEAGEAAARLPSDWDVAALHELLWPGSPREGGSMGLGFGGGGRAPGAAGAAPQPPPAELSLAELWLKMPSVMP